jgi:ribosomal protein S18 acetylase RimI-like enzyme
LLYKPLMTNLQNDKKLDNPVWHSLNEVHEKFSLTYDNLKCYGVDYCPFGGYTNNKSISRCINEYAKLIDNFFIVGGKPGFPEGVAMKKELICLQMVIGRKPAAEIHEEVVKLNHTNDKELFDMVNLVQPGYFKSKTILLGDYYGIFKNEVLVSVTGERMKMDDFTEISAVVTHPDYTGKGYAKQLIAHTVNKIFDENKIPYLHVAEENIGAIKLYDKLGFTTRRKISFWNFQRNSFKK